MNRIEVFDHPEQVTVPNARGIGRKLELTYPNRPGHALNSIQFATCFDGTQAGLLQQSVQHMLCKVIVRELVSRRKLDVDCILVGFHIPHHCRMETNVILKGCATPESLQHEDLRLIDFTDHIFDDPVVDHLTISTPVNHDSINILRFSKDSKCAASLDKVFHDEHRSLFHTCSASINFFAKLLTRFNDLVAQASIRRRSRITSSHLATLVCSFVVQIDFGSGHVVSGRMNRLRLTPSDLWNNRGSATRRSDSCNHVASSVNLIDHVGQPRVQTKVASVLNGELATTHVASQHAVGVRFGIGVRDTAVQLKIPYRSLAFRTGGIVREGLEVCLHHIIRFRHCWCWGC